MGIKDRKERGKQEMRQRILETAIRLFVEDGFENVSMRRIAEEIEYSVATLYLYFKNKDEIFWTLRTLGFQKFYEMQKEADAIAEPLERMRKGGEIYVRFALENPEYYDIMFIMRATSLKLDQVSPEEIQNDIGMASFYHLCDDVENCMKSGIFREGINVQTAAFGIWSLMHGMMALILRGRLGNIPSEQIPLLIEDASSLMMESLFQPFIRETFSKQKSRVRVETTDCSPEHPMAPFTITQMNL